MIEEFKRYLLYKKHVSPRTISMYSSHVNEFMKWYNINESKEFIRLDKKIIDSYKNYLILIKNNKIQTVNGKICALSMLHKFLYYKNLSKNYICRKSMVKSK